MSEFRLKDSKIYPGVEHQGWLYVPAQYDGRKPIALMVFLDGTRFVARDGGWRVPAVLNNLIAKQALPVMAAVFVDAGEATEVSYQKASDGSPLLTASYKDQRGIEYHETLNADYANFLVNKVLPEVRKHVRIASNPEGRGIAGHSSGGNCAVTVAWNRPDEFRKAFSANGSFPVRVRSLKGLLQLVRENDRKPIRLVLQSGVHDKSSPEWGVGAERHRDLTGALKDNDYDYQYLLGEGMHSPAHAASILPDVLRWFWRDYQK